MQERGIMPNKRGTKRKTKRLPVMFSHEWEKHIVRSSHLSESGVFVKTGKPLAPNAPIKIIMKTESEMGIRLFFHALIG